MEQRKTDIDTGDNNTLNINANGANYTFDLPGQVGNVNTNYNTVPIAPVTINPQNHISSVNVEPVQPVSPMPAVEPVNVEPVQPVSPMPAVEPVNVEPVQPVSPMPAAEPAQTFEQQVVQNNAEDLIKDKKDTKKFLIIIVIITVVFIVALPFIFKILG